jgi:hypothetical protein
MPSWRGQWQVYLYGYVIHRVVQARTANAVRSNTVLQPVAVQMMA